MPISTSIKIGVASLGIVGATTAFVYSKRDKIKETWSKLSPKKKFAVKAVATVGGGAVLGLCLGHGYLVGKAAYVSYQAGMWALPVGLVVAAKRTFVALETISGVASIVEAVKKQRDKKAEKAAKAAETEVEEDAPEDDEEVVTLEKKSKSPNKAQAVAEEIGADEIAAQFVAEHSVEKTEPVSRAVRRNQAKQAKRKDNRQVKPRHHKDPMNKAKIEWSPDQNGDGRPMIQKFEE